MFRCTVKYGTDVEPLSSESPIRVGDIRRNQNLKRALGFSDNVNAMLNSVVLADDVVIPNGAQIVLETAANRKAVAA